MLLTGRLLIKHTCTKAIVNVFVTYPQQREVEVNTEIDRQPDPYEALGASLTFELALSLLISHFNVCLLIIDILMTGV